MREKAETRRNRKTLPRMAVFPKGARQRQTDFPYGILFPSPPCKGQIASFRAYVEKKFTSSGFLSINCTMKNQRWNRRDLEWLRGLLGALAEKLILGRG